MGQCLETKSNILHAQLGQAENHRAQRKSLRRNVHVAFGTCYPCSQNTPAHRGVSGIIFE